jgi:hypothetical protein
VRAAIVNGEHLDVLMTVATIAVFVLDPEVWKMDLVIEVRQVMLHRPEADLILVAIGMTVVVVPLAIVLVQPLLVIPLQLVVENDAVNSRALCLQALCHMKVGVVDL